MFENKWVFLIYETLERCCWRAEEINNTSCVPLGMDHMFWQFKPNLCKEWILIFIFIFIFFNICILETKNLIAKQKRWNQKKHWNWVLLRFWWARKKPRFHKNKKKTKQSWNIIIIIKAFKVFCHVQLFCIHSIRGLEFQN